jgi:hypothetical protein
LRRFARIPSRVLALAGAMALGTIGTLALASPASATFSKLTAEVKCGPTADTATVTWTLENEVDKDAKVVSINRALEGLAVDTVIPANSKVTASEDVKLSEESVKLVVTLRWGMAKKTFDERANLKELDCTPKPTAEFTDNCDGTTVVKVTNPEDGKTVKIAVNGKGEFVERKELAPGETWEVTVPADNAEHVRVKFPGGEQIADHNWQRPEKCHTVEVKSTCDNLIITVTNTGLESIEAIVKAGDEEESKTIGPGEAAEATIPGSEGLVATLTVVDGDKKFTEEIKYEKPDDCAPTLPVTGVNAGLLAGAALVLVSGGVGLFVVARRRRIRFAA